MPKPWEKYGAQPNVGTIIADPYQARDEQRKDSTTANEGARLAIAERSDARDAALAPMRARILAAQAAKAEADAKEATVGEMPIDPKLDRLTGQAYREQLPAQVQAQAQALIDGRMAFPSGAALRSPYWQQMLQHVSHIDPSFDAVNYNARAGVRRSFTSGKDAANITSLNTAIGHLGQLASQIDGTASHGGLPGATRLSSAENAFARSAGSAGITNYEQTAGAVASELTQVFRGSGGAEADINRELEHLNANGSLAQKQAAVRNIAGLLKSRLDALNDKYQQGMGTTATPLQILNHHAQAGYDMIGTLGGGTPPSGGNSGGPNNPPPSDGSGMSSVAGGVTSAPKQGDTFSDAAGVEITNRIADAYRGGADLAGLNKILTDNGYQPFTDPDAIKKIQARQPMNFGPPEADDQRSAVGKALEGIAGGGAAGAYGLNALDAVTGGYLDEIAGGRTQMAKDYAASEHPIASLLGSATGGAAAMLPIGRAAEALSAGSRIGRALIGTGARAAATGDAAYGALLGSGEDNDNRLGGAGMGVAAALAGNIGGTALARAGGAAIRGVADPAVRYLHERGVPLTIGQIVGNQGAVGRFVNKAESLPVIGDFLNARRRQGFEAYNRADLADVVEPIGGTAPVAGGQEGIADVQQQVSDAYERALNGVRVQADPQFVQELGSAMQRGRAVPVQGEQFGHVMDTRVVPLFGPGGTLDGDTAQAAIQAVRDARSQFGGEGAMGSLVADELGNIDTSIAALLTRQAPQAAQGLADANAAYARLAARNKASQTAVNSGLGAGVYSPAQLNRAVTQNTRRFGGEAAAARGDNMSDLNRYAQEVLPSTVPDSGTPGRIAAMLLPAALGGGALGLSNVSPESAATLGLIAAATSRPGANLIQRGLINRSAVMRRAGQAVIDNAGIARLLTAPLALAVSN